MLDITFPVEPLLKPELHVQTLRLQAASDRVRLVLSLFAEIGGSWSLIQAMFVAFWAGGHLQCDMGAIQARPV